MKMHQSDAQSLVELWAVVKNYIPVKDRKDAAHQFIVAVEEAGLVDYATTAADLYGVCDVFDKVLSGYCQDNGLDEGLEDDDWDE